MKKQLGLMGQAAKGYRGTAHGRFDDTCQLWLQATNVDRALRGPSVGRSASANGSGLTKTLRAGCNRFKNSEQVHHATLRAVCEGQEGKARVAAVIAALVHHKFYAGDT